MISTLVSPNINIYFLVNLKYKFLQISLSEVSFVSEFIQFLYYYTFIYINNISKSQILYLLVIINGIIFPSKYSSIYKIWFTIINISVTNN